MTIILLILCVVLVGVVIGQRLSISDHENKMEWMIQEYDKLKKESNEDVVLLKEVSDFMDNEMGKREIRFPEIKAGKN
ncbi:MAG: hypothetical protein IMZ58_08205 [Thermoplasmata archaeon]|nr:hypothetical protein [Thermoplasmata archaeon]